MNRFFTALTVTTLLLAGCAATGRKVTEEQLSTIQRGHTSCYDVVVQLGKPNATELAMDGTKTLVYEYTQTQLKPENFIPFAELFLGGQTAETTTATIWCDTQHRVIGYTARQGQTTAGWGITSGARQ